ncbi:MAG TPA: hypothetical protein DIW77_11945 [Chromatiaceae bacterium]|jgi:hypothetical protein|nr:MAG: hypothetical protein N838_20020 [Thiohalocapsa sp. PB-PSB1]HCS90726.1 hypothetical protein [Chromatiaceae bacterium]
MRGIYVKNGKGLVGYNVQSSVDDKQKLNPRHRADPSSQSRGRDARSSPLRSIRGELVAQGSIFEL